MEDRLNRLLEYEQLSPSRFADLIGVQRSSVSHILSGRNKPSFDFLQKTMKAFPDLRADWLILGKGEMYPDQAQRSRELFGPEPVEMQEIPLQEALNPAEEQSGKEMKESSDTGIIQASKGKSITRVMVFYEDNTFTTHYPTDS